MESELEGAASRRGLKVIRAHYDVQRVAILLDMSTKWVKERVHAGDLEGYRLGGKVVITAASISTYLDNRRVQPVS